MLITVQEPGPAQRSPPGAGPADATVPTPVSARSSPILASVGPEQNKLFNSFGGQEVKPRAGSRLALPGPAWRPHPHLAGGPGGRTTACPPSSQTPPPGFPPASRPALLGAAALAAAGPPQPLPRALPRPLRPQPEPPFKRIAPPPRLHRDA